MKVQLLYFPGCPNVDAARETLKRALSATKTEATIEEIDTSAPGTPEALRGWASPTVLVEGCDVAGGVPAGADCCRLYDSPVRGVPPMAEIRAALERARPRR